MRLLAAVLAFIMAWLVIPAGLAAKVQPQKFALHKPVFEPAVTVCLVPEPVLRMIPLAAAGELEQAGRVVGKAASEGKCGVLRNVEIVYTKQLLVIETADTVFAAYEARYNGVTIYVPMEGFIHDGVDA